VLHGGGDLEGFYQILALKIKTSRHSFIHIGYNLQDFDTPNSSATSSTRMNVLLATRFLLTNSGWSLNHFV